MVKFYFILSLFFNQYSVSASSWPNFHLKSKRSWFLSRFGIEPRNLNFFVFPQVIANRKPEPMITKFSWLLTLWPHEVFWLKTLGKGREGPKKRKEDSHTGGLFFTPSFYWTSWGDRWLIKGDAGMLVICWRRRRWWWLKRWWEARKMVSVFRFKERRRN